MGIVRIGIMLEAKSKKAGQVPSIPVVGEACSERKGYLQQLFSLSTRYR